MSDISTRRANEWLSITDDLHRQHGGVSSHVFISIAKTQTDTRNFQSYKVRGKLFLQNFFRPTYAFWKYMFHCGFTSSTFVSRLYHLHGKPHPEKQMLISPRTLVYASFYFCVGRRESLGHYSSSFILTPGVPFVDSIHQRLSRDA